MKKLIFVFVLALLSIGVNAQLKKDGTPDLRFKANKEKDGAAATAAPKAVKQEVGNSNTRDAGESKVSKTATHHAKKAVGDKATKTKHAEKTTAKSAAEKVKSTSPKAKTATDKDREPVKHATDKAKPTAKKVKVAAE